MAYFGRQPKKPQQLGRVFGGTTRPSTTGLEPVDTPAGRGEVRARQQRAGRANRVLRNARAVRESRS